jgi:hypothetical protein
MNRLRRLFRAFSGFRRGDLPPSNYCSATSRSSVISVSRRSGSPIDGADEDVGFGFGKPPFEDAANCGGC